MKIYILITCLLFSTGTIIVSCQSKTQGEEMNIPVNQLKMKEQFPNQKLAFEKINNEINFYKPSGTKIMTINLKTAEYYFYFPDEEYSKYLFKINDFRYFSPSISIKSYEFPLGNIGTGIGKFSTIKKYNEIGLIDIERITYPESDKKNEFDVKYSYNKLGQLLKVIENNKIDIENKYDSNGNLSEIKTPTKHIKYQYTANDKIIKAEIEENGVKNILNYFYNSSGLLERRFNDNYNIIEEFQYDSNDRVVTITKYLASVDKIDPNKLINHFIKKTYEYDGKFLFLEKETEYNIINASVLVEKKWKTINIEEQRKLAWKIFRENSEMPLSEIEKRYSYSSGEINITESKYSFSNRIKNNKTEQYKEIVNSDKIKFTINNEGKIIRKETLSIDNKNIIEEYSY